MPAVELPTAKPPLRRSRPSPARLLKVLRLYGEWAKSHADLVAECYVVQNGASTSLYVLTHAETFDFVLSRKLSAFALPHIVRGDLAEVALVPRSTEEELTAFFDPAQAVRLAAPTPAT